MLILYNRYYYHNIIVSFCTICVFTLYTEFSSAGIAQETSYSKFFRANEVRDVIVGFTNWQNDSDHSGMVDFVQ